jgi:uncharacterized membrane protein YfcA
VDTGQDLLLGMGALTLAYVLAIVFVAAFVRGYSGFGSSAVFVTGTATVLPPSEVVPITLFLEVAASLGLLAQVWRDVAWRATAWILVGAAIGMPFGFWLLANLPADIMRATIAILVLSASVALWFGYSFKGRAGRGHTLGTGVVSGVANGIAGVGGLPVVLFLLSTAAGAAMSRATMIVYLMVIDVYGAGVAWANGLMSVEVLLRTALFCVPLSLGVWAGHRHFVKTTPESFRRMTLILLMVLASAGLVRALAG